MTTLRVFWIGWVVHFKYGALGFAWIRYLEGVARRGATLERA
jgi:hypothetical protein